MKATVIPALLLLSSCATIKPISSTNIDSQTSSSAPASTRAVANAREYARESQRQELATVIANPDYEAPKFLKDVHNEKVEFWIQYFSKKDKDRFERFIKNGLKYKDIIESTFDDYGLPKELFYVGLIESGYYLGAKSHAGAVGPWQFIRETGRRYGLTVNSRVDERRNIHKATKAAAHFFQDLYNIFGSWELALSAYNAGENGLIRRIRKHDIRDYYELSRRRIIPKETRHYVPKVLAAMKVLKNPKKYNIQIPKNIENPYTNTQELFITKSVNLASIAKRKKITVSKLRALNPDLKSNTVPYIYRKGFSLRVPNGDYRFVASLKPASVSKKQDEAHIVSRGENLISIANRYNISLKTLLAANKLSRRSIIYVGQKLEIPGNTKPEYLHYTVQRGDNLYTLARQNNSSISSLVKINGLKSKRLYVGQKLKLPSIEKVYHTVRPGDYLGKIAKKYGTSVAKIKSINQLKKSRIYAGQKLLVKVD